MLDYVQICSLPPPCPDGSCSKLGDRRRPTAGMVVDIHVYIYVASSDVSTVPCRGKCSPIQSDSSLTENIMFIASLAQVRESWQIRRNPLPHHSQPSTPVLKGVRCALRKQLCSVLPGLPTKMQPCNAVCTNYRCSMHTATIIALPLKPCFLNAAFPIRFCNHTLTDWKASLTPESLKPEVKKVQPIMVVYFEGEIHR